MDLHERCICLGAAYFLSPTDEPADELNQVRYFGLFVVMYVVSSESEHMIHVVPFDSIELACELIVEGFADLGADFLTSSYRG